MFVDTISYSLPDSLTSGPVLPHLVKCPGVSSGKNNFCLNALTVKGRQKIDYFRNGKAGYLITHQEVGQKVLQLLQRVSAFARKLAGKAAKIVGAFQ